MNYAVCVVMSKGKIESILHIEVYDISNFLISMSLQRDITNEYNVKQITLFNKGTQYDHTLLQ